MIARASALAFLAGLGNNSFDTLMRLACGLAFALWLNPGAVKTARPQEASGQSAVKPAAPAEAAAAAEQKAGESEAKKATESGSASAARNLAKRRKRVASPAGGTPRKIVVREGGASEPAAQIAPDITPAEAARERHNAEQWLGSSDNQLKQLAGRRLNAQQQEAVGQIRNYMDGARSALKEGDVRRASTLAQKAHLLADDLVKQ